MKHWEEHTTPGVGRRSPTTPRLVHTSVEMGCGVHRSVTKEWTQDGQEGNRPQETQSRTHPIDENEMGPAVLDECTQDGQGGSGPQETQGRTEAYIIRRTAHGTQTECAQDGQGGSGP